jgi:hypothetical protein
MGFHGFRSSYHKIQKIMKKNNEIEKKKKIIKKRFEAKTSNGGPLMSLCRGLLFAPSVFVKFALFFI